MKVRVLLDGVPMEPAPSRSSTTAAASASAARWPSPAGVPPRSTGPGRSPPPAGHTVTVEFRNLHTWDSATLLRWTLTVQHA